MSAAVSYGCELRVPGACLLFQGAASSAAWPHGTSNATVWSLRVSGVIRDPVMEACEGALSVVASQDIQRLVSSWPRKRRASCVLAGRQYRFAVTIAYVNFRSLRSYSSS